MSEDKVLRYEEDTPHVLISISSPGGGVTPPENDARVEMLRLQFHDVTKCEKGDPFFDFLTGHKVEIVPPSREDGAKIAAFVLKHRNIPMLIVNCEAGISRSSGIAAAVSKFFNGDDSEFYDSGKYHPNDRIRRFVLEELMRNDQQEEIQA